MRQRTIKTTDSNNKDEHIPAGMVQYLEIKSRHAGMMLFYRMGDFYELFFEDAVKAAAILDIALTKRGMMKGEPIQMCGVPVHSSDGYLERLIAAGEKVAICEQLETAEEAKKRGYKAIMHRDVVRIVTAGTITEAGLLKPAQANYIVSIGKVGAEWAVAWSDITTGEFGTISLDLSKISEVLASYPPSELLIPKALVAAGELVAILAEYDGVITEIDDVQQSTPQLAPFALTQPSLSALTPPPLSQGERGAKTSLLHTNISTQSVELPSPLGRGAGGEGMRVLGEGEIGFGEGFERMLGEAQKAVNVQYSDADLSACGMLHDYIALTQKQFSPRLDAPTKHHHHVIMQIDAATKRNLELHCTLSGERAGSLLSVLDATVTAAGARLLNIRLSQPSMEKHIITQRLDAVEWGINYAMRNSMRDSLRRLPDLERAIGRLHMGKDGAGKGSPRDMVAIMNGLQIVGFIKVALYDDASLPLELQQIAENIGNFDAIINQLQNALVLEPPLLARDGGFVKAAFHPSLDEFRTLRDESKRVVAQMQANYATQTNIPSLKVKHNNVLGYFVEIARRFEANAPASFIHRQTITDCLRYSTVELGEMEHKIINAAAKALKLELEIFEELRLAILAHSDAIIAAARAIAQLDLILSFAEIAHLRRYVRPTITNNKELHIVAGRHPVVEQMQQKRGTSFIHNDCMLGDMETLWLLTGPNMAGKSTFLRQNALIAIMAHVGAYVPADSATIGVIDKCFSRVGAADDLARGQSTFMVEMVETATILNQATARSLVILDEIGRGTATYDGMAIAGAVVEHLHNHIRCRALFATHYHELTRLAGSLPSLACYTMQVKEWRGEVKFLHQVGRGVADRSYGVHVAALAGLPAAVVKRAKHLLVELEKGAENHADLPLFSGDEQGNITVIGAAQQQVLEHLQQLNIDDLTPKAALQQLYELREMLANF